MIVGEHEKRGGLTMNRLFNKKGLKKGVTNVLLASLLAGTLSVQAPIQVMADDLPGGANTTVVNGGFETGDLTGWTLLDGTSATNDNNSVGVVSDAQTYWGARNYYKEGNYFLSGAEKENGSGAIRSTSFTLGADGYISFLIGAAAAEGKGCVKVMKEAAGEDELVKTYVNQNWSDPTTGNTLLRIYDKLDDYVGDTLYFVVENGSEAGFSFINADDFRASLTLEDVQALYRSDVERVRNISDEYAETICGMYRDTVLYGTDTKVGTGLETGEVTVVSSPSGTVELQAGSTVNIEERIRNSAVVKDEFGITADFSVSVNSVQKGGENVTGDLSALALSDGTYVVTYTLTYQSKGETKVHNGEFTILASSYEIGATIVNGDFETGDLTGWTLMDGSGATNANNPVGEVSDDHLYWGNRYLYQQGNYALRGDVKEGQSGLIRSRKFRLGGEGYISFMIGTAAEEEKGCVRLYRVDEDQDVLVKTYTNPYWNDPKTGLTLIRMYDQFPDNIGDIFYFEVVNGSKAGFSFISVDDFRTSLTRKEVKTLQDDQLESIQGINDEYKDEIISCFRKSGIINELIVEKEPGEQLQCFAGVKLDLKAKIKRETRIIKSYSRETVDVSVNVDRITYQGSEVSLSDEEFVPSPGIYTVEYTRLYGDKTEQKEVELVAQAVDKTVTDVENGGFETGTLEGWEVETQSVWNRDESGNFMGVVSANDYWGEKLPYNQEGDYHLNGWNVTDNENATWSVRSSAFTLAGSGWISARMGGHAAEMRVYNIDGTMIGSYAQTRFNDANFPFVGQGGSWADMGTYFVDLHEHLGETLYIELRDKTVAGWALAFFDDVKCYYESAPDLENGYDTVIGPIGRNEDESLIYDEIRIPWTQLFYHTQALGLSFEEEGYQVINSAGKQETAELAGVLKEPKYQDEPVEPYRPNGVSGKALNFDGYSTYASFEEAIGGSKLTVEAYVCPRVFMWDGPATPREQQLAQVIVGSYDESAKQGFLVGVTKHGYPAFRVGTGDHWYSLSTEDGMTLPTYEWSRITAVFDGEAGEMKLYINGEEAGSMTVEAGCEIIECPNPVRVGKGSKEVLVADNIFDGTMFCGLMDEVTVTRDALSAQQVEQSGMTMPEISYADAMAPDSALTNDYFRPTYHALPSGNWMNEPHALFQYNGKWHLFYQINPSGPYWHNISWGHWVSDDMVQWKYVKEAVIPTEGTISPDGVWTGNVIFSSDGKPLLLITAGDDSRPVNGSNQHVGLVRADNYDDPELTDWTIIGYAVAQTPEMGTAGEFRDAQAFGLDDECYMVVGGAKDGRGVAHVFKTTAKTVDEWEQACSDGVYNGMNWEYKGDLFGDFYTNNDYESEYGTVWEMPNLVPLPNETGEESGKYLFVFSPQNGDNDVWYYIGEFDKQSCRFVPDFAKAKRMDYGNNIYTGPTVYKNAADGKVYICSVMQENVQGEEIVRPIAEHELAGWAFYAGLPRELYLRSDNSLGIRHIDTTSIEGNQLAAFRQLSAEEANAQLANINSDCIRIDFEFSGSAQQVGLRLKKDGDSYTTLYLTEDELGLDNAKGEYHKGDTVTGTVYVDKCSIEAYIDNCITVSGSKYIRGGGVEVIIDGDATCSMVVTQMNSIHNAVSKEQEPGENPEGNGSNTDHVENGNATSETNPSVVPDSGNNTDAGSGKNAETDKSSKKDLVSKIKLSGVSHKIAAGRKITLKAKVTLASGKVSNSKLTWKSSNKKYATVTKKGVVKVKKAGIGKTVKITAYANDGSGKKAVYSIRIMKQPVKKIVLKSAVKKVATGKKVTIHATVTPSKKKNTNTALTWSSSNVKYATVNQKGVVKTKKAGKGHKVTITAKATDGSNKKATIKLKIK